MLGFVSGVPFLRSRQQRVLTSRRRRRSHVFMVLNDAEHKVRSKDAVEFFKHREGEWESWRVTHHLAFRRAETGESLITMKCLPKDDERVVQLCIDHGFDPAKAQGGCYVTWRATMAWDQEGENHEGATVFALVPEEGDTRKGKMLRDRGYAEIVPIAGSYYLDEDDDLCLETPYDGGSVEERFSFDGPDIVNRTSNVRRFGGVATSTFSTEKRVGSQPAPDIPSLEETFESLLFFRGDVTSDGTLSEERNNFKSRLSTRSNFATNGPPSAGSAFGSGFSTSPASSAGGAGTPGFSGPDSNASAPSGEQGPAGGVAAAAAKARIDLSKVPPSMRDEFLASFKKESAAMGKKQSSKDSSDSSNSSGL